MSQRPSVPVLILLVALHAAPGAATEPVVPAVTPIEPPFLAARVASGALPPVAARLPAVPAVAAPTYPWQSIGRHGGDLRVLMTRARDTRMLYVYGYARLVRFTPDLTLQPDLLERFEVDPDQRTFTLHLRPGHRWSDGHPFTTEDFRYWWEEKANNRDLSPLGPPVALLVDGEPPTVEILDPVTVRYRWTRPNPYFLPLLAGARPIEIYLPAHILRLCHPHYADPAALERLVKAAGVKSWAHLHNRIDDMNRFDNPDLPTLQPWMITTPPPSERFLFVRNPYYHRIDPDGRQLPYLDRVVMSIADTKLIPAKTGAGEADLQARYLRFDTYTFLKAAEARTRTQVRLWRSGIGAEMALYPNLNARDPVWRALLRDVRFRRALSLGINREEINQVIYYGLATPSNNTVLDVSPLWRDEYRTRWAGFDLAAAAALLDQIGLPRAGDGMRLLPDGRPLQLIVETAGDRSEEADILELIADGWRHLGIRLLVRPIQIDVLRSRVYAGDAVMVASLGLDNGIPTAAMSPRDLAPTAQVHYQWPKWGQYFETRGASGEKPALPEAERLLTLLRAWETAPDEAGRRDAWQAMLASHAESQFTIGLVNSVPQPVVVRANLRNLPVDGLFNYEPGAHFGLYQPDFFWYDRTQP